MKAEELTPAEKEVCLKVCQGLPVRVIAMELGKSIHTINGQTESIYRKWNINCIAQLVRSAIERGVLEVRLPAEGRAQRIPINQRMPA